MPMTVGELSRRTGLSHKSIRELEGRGLIYSVGRSESGYRLFDENALWCVGAIGELRSLGLTLAEIEELHADYLENSELPSGPRLTRMLERSAERVRARIAADQRTLTRIEEFEEANREMLAGGSEFLADDPCAKDFSRRRR
jgi:MerR family transcriptional regulator, copper efflux regulator